MDALQFTYGGDDDGDTSEANSPPPSVQDGETEDSTTTAAADISVTNSELLEYNQADEIKDCLQTASAEIASSGETPLCGTLQAMNTDQIGQLTTAVRDGGTAGNSTTITVDKSGMNSELPERNQVDIIKVGFETTASRDVSVGEKTLYGENPLYEKPPAMETNQVDEIKESLQTAVFGDASSSEISQSETPQAMDTDQILQLDNLHSPDLSAESDDNEEEALPLKKQKHLSDFPTPNSSEHVITELLPPADIAKPPAATKASKKSKKKNKDVWSTTTRKGKKKTKHASNSNHNSKGPTNGDASIEDKVLIAPVPRFPDKNDDSPDMNICLSKVCKAEKVELSDDRMSASSTKGYRMVKATRGVSEGAWYFEIKVVHLGETGHTRLGWSTENADLQAPVGYDGSSFGYRDIGGYKLHKALRDKYGDGEGYKEGDVIGFYISLPDGGAYAPSPQKLVWHKGQRYVCASNAKEEPKVVPGSEISYFRNGICQGVAFTDLYGGCYYPAASMYTLPNQPPCVVKFNFGPEFEMFPEDFGERPVPRPMFEVPYQSYDGKVETGTPWVSPRRPMLPVIKVLKEETGKIMKASNMVG